VVAKHCDGQTSFLQELLQRHLSQICHDRYFVHLNDNNLTVVPRCLGKHRAVEYVLNRYTEGQPALSLGFGDSLSDAPFLAACDFAVMPRKSQLLRALFASQETRNDV